MSGSIKRNILFIADPASVHDGKWINYFASLGFACFVIARRRHVENGVLSVKGKTLHDDVSIIGAIDDPSVVRPVRNAVEVMKIRSLIKRHEIQLLHIMYAEPNALWANWKAFFKVPIIVTTRGTDILRTIPDFFDGRSLLRKIVARRYLKAFSTCDQITCTSLKQIKILEQLGVKSKMMLVRTGVDLAFVRSCNMDAAKAFDLTKPFFLMPRSMRPLYNHELTLEAIRLLKDETENFSFVFVNADTADRAYFKQIRDLAATIHADIRFLPTLSQAELISLYKQAAMVIMSPLSDGSPVSAMEAMACNVPVLIPPLEYDPELFGDAYIFTPFTAEGLKLKIQLVLKETPGNLQRRLKQNAKIIETKGNRAIEMEKIKQIYENIIDRWS